MGQQICRFLLSATVLTQPCYELGYFEQCDCLFSAAHQPQAYLNSNYLESKSVLRSSVLACFTRSRMRSEVGAVNALLTVCKVRPARLPTVTDQHFNWVCKAIVI